MRTITRVLLTCALAAVALPGLIAAAPLLQTSPDPRSLAITPADLPPGFAVVPDRTVSEDRPDGVAVYDVTFVRQRSSANLAAGAVEVRSGVARTARGEDAIQQLASTREAFSADGWKSISVPALGDDSVGLSQTTEGDGGPTISHSYLFRKGQWILMIAVRGRPDVTKVDDAVSLAIVVSQRLDRALGGGQPAQTASGAPATKPRTALTERVRVVSAGGANVRAEPSIGTAVVTEAAEGMILEVAGPDREADARTWRNVRLSDGRTGWIAASLVETLTPPPAPAASPSPGPAAAPSPAPVSGGPATLAAPPNQPVGAANQPVGAPNPPAATAPTDDAGSAPGLTDGGAAPVAGADSPGPVTDSAEATGGGPGTGTSTNGSPNVSAEASSPAPPASTGGTTARATGPGGLTVEATVRDATLSAGNQQVKILVTRNGQPVSDARVDVTARLDARRYRAINADPTNGDGRTEVEWEMTGPPGDYEVIAEVRVSDNDPPTTATTKFRWK